MEKKSQNRIYIIGAGFAGRAIAEEIKKKGILGEVIAFLDDDPVKIGTKIDGTPVLGPIEDVVNLIDKTPTDEALLAIPSASKEKLTTLYTLLQKARFSRIRILPSISQIVEGEAHLIQTRDIDPQDLLGRNPLPVNLTESSLYLRGKRVLVTGAGGSIGSEIARQLLSAGVERLYLFGHGENSIYEIDKELRILQEEGVGEKTTIVPVIGELKDRDYTAFILNRLKADVIFHCAAYKHVPLMEANPVEAVKNNVFGTLHLVEAARISSTQRFIFISTDKAVEPISMYGASKLLAETIVLDQAEASIDFIVVRFGNVLGSRGSILPLLRKQILKGGPITLTDERTSRFFMTIPEAVSLVIKVGGIGKGNHLYFLDMGEPLKIKELAYQMIRFFGFEPEREIPIKYIGMRPGEKISERLYSHHEVPVETEFQRILKINQNGALSLNLEEVLAILRPICFFSEAESEKFRNKRLLREIFARHIPSMESLNDEPEY